MSTAFSSTPALPVESSDLVIVGAGIVGLAHAYEALRRGLTVTVVERDRRPVGASVRNFGHCCVTAQHGELLALAHRSREGWLRAAADAGLWAEEAGALVVARSATELAVLEELRDVRGPDTVRLRTGAEVARTLGRESAPGGPDGVVGGAFLPEDLRVDPRAAAPGLARWTQTRPGGRILWGTSVTGVESGTVHTTRGPVRGERILVCVGHDLDRLFPGAAEEHGILRCSLNMARVVAPARFRTHAAVLTGTSMLRYDGFTATTAAGPLAAEITAHSPELTAIGANVMFTRLPDGTVLVGDSHAYDETAAPFVDEHTSELLLEAVGEVLGAGPLKVVERWQGVYASSPSGPLLVRDLAPGVRALSVTSGIGMTLSFGLAAASLDGTLPATAG
ncbi:TIGR03364 family FAD-dependent oxidoreductase [Streptomyces tsukubensis]|uniref:Oxidoreductase n=1 Tax=Streptomyces tsukubensis TaxID=83656 RepID=A0A1V4A866_9ACTN|nr:TIGR03364 family FAD-dependent oxidoreductase [Streptomyces tsukubensis]OON78034.1 oxidoreductase [Streptomyces tsukubensis]QFR97199.1 TIGR03364 family FAD-dependent oxidoreductase [Streptomyces tsukubensis]